MKVWVACSYGSAKPIAVFSDKALAEAFMAGLEAGKIDGVVEVTHVDVTELPALEQQRTITFMDGYTYPK